MTHTQATNSNSLENPQSINEIQTKDTYSIFIDALNNLIELYKQNNKNGDEEKKLKVVEYLKALFATTWNNHIYVKSVSKYYWIEWKVFINWPDLCDNLSIWTVNLYLLRRLWVIRTYNKISYFDWEEDMVYNLFNKSTLLKPSQIPKLDENIEYLINNLCWNNKESIEYLHKSILYKYTHLNDVRVPAVVFYGAWWSWKWTFIKLLSKIFWNENVLSNLWKQDLTSQFTPFKWDKMIVSFDEIVTNNTNEDVNITNKLKNLIFAEEITINQKYVNMYQTKNSAWFFISSNNNTPIKLDDSSVWNRRFSIIYSDKKLNSTKKIYESINNNEIVSNYLAWLYENYKEVLEYDCIEALDNEDKKDLEFASKNESNLFWDWFEEKHPELYWKVEKSTIDRIVVEYLWINDEIDKKEFYKYFWKNSRYMKKRFRVNWKLTYWALIPKNEDLLKIKDEEQNQKKLKDDEILKKVWLFWSENHWVNENWKVVECSVDKLEEEFEVSFDFARDL